MSKGNFNIGDVYKNKMDTYTVKRVTEKTVAFSSKRFPNLTPELSLANVGHVLAQAGFKCTSKKSQENSTFRGTKPYLVMSKGVIVATEYDRERAREVKAQLGGKACGVTIQRVASVEEVR